jgi:hypothetical protein
VCSRRNKSTSWFLGANRETVRAIRNPYVVLAAAAVVTLALEFFRGVPAGGTSPVWPVLEAAVAGGALLYAWYRQNELRFAPTLALAVGFQLAWVVLHLAHGVPSDYDSQVVYSREGGALVHGTYPATVYPPGAVLIFALDYVLGGSHTRVSHAFVMIPFQALLVFALWSLRTRWSAWFAVAVAFWPASAFITEFKFDGVAAALLALGAVCVLRERWVAAGALLGLGAAVKWTPALTVAALGLWLLTTNRGRLAARFAGAAVLAFLLVNLPFLVWSPHDVLEAYRSQGSRGITGESLPYLPLRALGLAHPREIWSAAVVPAWANPTAIVVQSLVLLLLLGAVVAVRRNPPAALSLAVLCPVAFLVFNRIFSPQFLIVLIAAWFVAGSLLARDRADQLLVAFLALASSVANALVYPTQARFWTVFSGFLFLFALAATAWVIARAEILQREVRAGDTERRSTSVAGEPAGLR